jgi:hypothetical protein
MRHEQAGHHLACPTPWAGCRCAELWHTDLRPDDDALTQAYALFYDPDFDPDARTPGLTYGGWIGAHRGSV